MSSLVSCDQFQYAPIDLATDAIRLVRLQKGSDYDPIICELFETFLHQVDGTPYEALSYTWGQSQELIQITLCGKKVLIRDGLFTALWHLRKPDEDRLFWIDAICIDQQSHLEKGHQVRQMRLIYQNAQNVHVWLGQSTDDIDMLMNHMNRLDKRALRRPDYRRSSPAAWENEWPILRDELDRLGTNKSNFHVRRCAAAMDLLEWPWFRRVWIIQEVFNAKIATVGCGLNSLPTRTFVLIPKLLGLGTSVLEIMPGYLRQQSWHSQRPTLHTLLRKFASCEATDLRDKVYALVGISSDAGTDGKLQPDYDTAVTMETVVHRTLSYLVFGEDSSSHLNRRKSLGRQEQTPTLGRRGERANVNWNRQHPP
ncbi:Heterokaryon incompatibility protein (HET) domain containing protein [Rhypophila decipiens]